MFPPPFPATAPVPISTTAPPALTRPNVNPNLACVPEAPNNKRARTCSPTPLELDPDTRDEHPGPSTKPVAKEAPHKANAGRPKKKSQANDIDEGSISTLPTLVLKNVKGNHTYHALAQALSSAKASKSDQIRKRDEDP